MNHDYGTLAVFLLGGVAFGFVILITNWLVRPRKPGKVKQETYECGLETDGPTWVQFKVSYFLYALLFVVFDVDAIFLYPWAVAFKSLGFFALFEMFIFVGILAAGLWYAWKKGALEWK
jgi:NADH-quinone oxidoreductase subunit A